MIPTTVFLIQSIRGAVWLNTLLYSSNFSIHSFYLRWDAIWSPWEKCGTEWFWHQQATVNFFITQHGESICQRMHSHLFSWSVLPQILPTAESSDTMSSVSACLYHVIFIKSPQWVTGHASRFNSRRNFLSGIMSKFKKEDYIGVDRGDSAIRQQNHCQGLYFLVIKCVTWHGMKCSYIISQSGCQLARC